MAKTVYLFDGTSLAYRAFYAIRNLCTSYGLPTNAVYGFIRMFLKLFKEFKPEYAAVAFDVGRKTFRNELLKEYKANRKPTPDNFKVQIPFIKEFLKCFGITVLEKEGYEADDVIGTVAKRLSKEGVKVFIVTSDKDMRQLIDENISIVAISPKSGEKKIYTLKTFKEEFGIEPSAIPDLFGLAGDQIDNIPGVPGIGEKTALQLIARFGSLENLYSSLTSLTPKRRELLERFKDQAFLSRELARIDTSVPVELSLDDLKVREPNESCLSDLLKKLEMKSIVEELKKLYPNLSLSSKTVERSKRLTLEEFKDKVLGFTLFPEREVALVHNSQPVIATEEGILPVKDSELLKLLPRTGRIFTFNLKELYHKYGEQVSKYPFYDLSLCSYLINPLLKSYSAKELLKEFLETAEIENVRDYAHYAVFLGRELLAKLKREGLDRLYRDIEHPLSYVLYSMERRGVLFDRDYLERFGEELELRCRQLQEEIWSIAGEEFNLNSTKQLSKVLFERLELKPLKRTKSGYSTDVETLVKLASEGHRIAHLLLEYRKLTKLNGTFVKGILKYMDSEGRVHTTFVQTGTATGRLSSAEPNLQNLPVSDELSKRIRYAVTAPEGYTLIWADYSQIELRILAHLSGDERLIEAYRRGKDIHTETAIQLFGAAEGNYRRFAKTVNFGIIYGMSPHGLSERLGISVQEAEEYINRYFEKFPGVKEYIERTLEEAYSKGYVRTLFGRKRPLPELKARLKNLRNFGERAAVNATIQGTAADIMKLAMVKLHRELEKEGAYMVLQVHDEIVVEAPEEKETMIKLIIKEIMEQVINLKVPLVLDVNSGDHWM